MNFWIPEEGKTFQATTLLRYHSAGITDFVNIPLSNKLEVTGWSCNKWYKVILEP